MIRKNQFKTPKNKLEGTDISFSLPKISESLCCNCPSCKKIVFFEDLKNNLGVCPLCSKHLRIKARERIQYMSDEHSFVEMFDDLKSSNVLNFPEYDDKL